MSATTIPRLIVFARVPRLGQVKTRVAATVGDQRALAIHRELLTAVLRRLGTGLQCERVLAIAGDDDGECARLAGEFGYLLVQQGQGDLGARMDAALRLAVDDGRLPVIVGSDCPSLEPRDLAEAFCALRRYDAVLSPATDGGYALVGVSRALPAMFSGIDWGTPDVLRQTRDALRGAAASWVELREVSDVDTFDDYQAWRASQ